LMAILGPYSDQEFAGAGAIFVPKPHAHCRLLSFDDADVLG
jgi:hypothetical protein